MKTILYYFSGTGNTLMLARLLAKELDDTEIVNIVSCNGSTPPPDVDAIGILFPVYAFGLPKIMRNFVKNNLQIADGTYVFSVTNYASAGGPGSLRQLKVLLKAKGSKLNSGFGIAMPANYIPFGGAENQEKQNKKFLVAAEKIKKATEKIKERSDNYFSKKTRIIFPITNLIHKFFMSGCKKDVKKFYVNDKCNGCKICVKICPTNNIKMPNKLPFWGANCEQCMACLQWCPQLAVQRKGVSESQTRYQNPGITVKDLIKDMKRE